MKKLLLIATVFATIATQLCSCKGNSDPDAGDYDDKPFAVSIPNCTVQAAAIDISGFIYITGTTTNSGIGGGKDGVFAQAYPGYASVYVAKYAPNGERIRVTYISGGNGQAIAVDGDRNVIIGGGTTDRNWPIKNAFQPEMKGTTPSCFLAKLNSSLKEMTFSTYIGGGQKHAPDAPDGTSIKNVRTDSGGNIHYIASGQDCDAPATVGIVGSRPPPYGHYQVVPLDHAPGYTGQPKWSNVFIGRFSPDGEMLSITCPTGDGPDTTSGVLAVSAGGDVYYGARTKSGQANMQPFPSKVGGQRIVQYDGGQAWFDGAVGRLARAGNDLVWASFLGGHAQNDPWGAAVDGDGRAVFVGSTKAGDFPVVNPLQSRNAGDHDWFVSRFTSSGSGLEFSTYLGGPNYDRASEVAIDSAGRTWVCGQGGKGFPGGSGAMLACISADGRHLDRCTPLGGQDATGLAIRGNSLVVTVQDGSTARIIKEKI